MTLVAAKRLSRMGRSTSALTVLCAWAGGHASAWAIGTGRAQAPPGTSFGLAVARISPPVRVPVTLQVLASIFLWRGSQSSMKARALGATVQLVGAALGSTGSERIASIARARGLRGERTPVCIVVNRHSGSKNLARRAVRALHREGVAVLSEEHTTGDDLELALDHAIEILPPNGRLVVAGGDGTVGRAAAIAAKAGRTLAILPTGTGNDIARSIRLSLHPEQAAAIASCGTTMAMDLGASDDGLFAHALSVGMTEAFAQAVHDIHGWRRPILYPVHAFRVWHRRGHLDVAIQLDGANLTMQSPPFQLAIVNAPRLGGHLGLNLPGASANDGYLHVVAVYKGALRRSLGALVHLLRSGVPHPPAGALLGAGRRIEVFSRTHYPSALDGEPAGKTPFTAWVVPSALRVVVPDPRT
jgi:diacylglycerol kinase family enzyme